MPDPGLPPPFLTFEYSNIQPNSAFSAVIATQVKPGYRLYRVVRKDNQATVVYKRNP